MSRIQLRDINKHFGGTPVLRNATDDNNAVKFADVVSGSVEIDVRGRSVTASAVDRYELLSPVNEWFDLLPGDNTLTLTGAASVDVTWRPAWYFTCPLRF